MAIHTFLHHDTDDPHISLVSHYQLQLCLEIQVYIAVSREGLSSSNVLESYLIVITLDRHIFGADFRSHIDGPMFVRYELYGAFIESFPFL